MKNDAIPATKIAAIITDLGGVLISVNHSSMIARFARHSPISAEEIGKSFDPRILSGHEVELGKDMKLFKEFILSFQFGHAKPEPQIYLEAMRRLGLKPQQCAFIDDVQEYADAATKVGMHGIHFVSAQQLESDLEKLGVKA